VCKDLKNSSFELELIRGVISYLTTEISLLLNAGCRLSNGYKTLNLIVHSLSERKFCTFNPEAISLWKFEEVVY